MTDDSDDDYLSANDMRSWLRQELRDIAKASELRTREATEFVTAYALGEMTAKEADDRHTQYHRRWGEALPGICVTDTVTDEKILAAIDEARRGYAHTDEARKTRASRGGRNQSGTSR